MFNTYLNTRERRNRSRRHISNVPCSINDQFKFSTAILQQPSLVKHMLYKIQAKTFWRSKLDYLLPCSPSSKTDPHLLL